MGNKDDPKASDDNDGSEGAPFKTINCAAAEARPGTKVLIRGRIYRKCVNCDITGRKREGNSLPGPFDSRGLMVISKRS